MKFLFQTILTALLSYAAEHFFPWWSVVICALVVAIGFDLNKITAFLGGFVAVSLLWMLVATIIDVKTNAILSNKIALLLGLQSTTSLILLTGMIGGIVGGLGALSGQQIRTLLKKEEQERVYKKR